MTDYNPKIFELLILPTSDTITSDIQFSTAGCTTITMTSRTQTIISKALGECMEMLVAV